MRSFARRVPPGADGFVLFNRFYQPDINLVGLRLRYDLQLSTPSEIRLPLLWIGILFGQIQRSHAASTGVGTASNICWPARMW